VNSFPPFLPFDQRARKSQSGGKSLEEALAVQAVRVTKRI
jgi:hypothetical protein